jgi:hypothetical protein
LVNPSTLIINSPFQGSYHDTRQPMIKPWLAKQQKARQPYRL